MKTAPLQNGCLTSSETFVASKDLVTKSSSDEEGNDTTTIVLTKRFMGFEIIDQATGRLVVHGDISKNLNGNTVVMKSHDYDNDNDNGNNVLVVCRNSRIGILTHETLIYKTTPAFELQDPVDNRKSPIGREMFFGIRPLYLSARVVCTRRGYVDKESIFSVVTGLDGTGDFGFSWRRVYEAKRLGLSNFAAIVTEVDSSNVVCKADRIGMVGNRQPRYTVGPQVDQVALISVLMPLLPNFQKAMGGMVAIGVI